MNIETERVADWFQAGSEIGSIAAECRAPCWCGAAPGGVRATIYESVPKTGYRWRVVSSRGGVERRGLIFVVEAEYSLGLAV